MSKVHEWENIIIYIVTRKILGASNTDPAFVPVKVVNCRSEFPDIDVVKGRHAHRYNCVTLTDRQTYIHTVTELVYMELASLA